MTVTIVEISAPTITVIIVNIMLISTQTESCIVIVMWYYGNKLFEDLFEFLFFFVEGSLNLKICNCMYVNYA